MVGHVLFLHHLASVMCNFSDFNLLRHHWVHDLNLCRIGIFVVLKNGFLISFRIEHVAGHNIASYWLIHEKIFSENTVPFEPILRLSIFYLQIKWTKVRQIFEVDVFSKLILCRNYTNCSIENTHLVPVRQLIWVQDMVVSDWPIMKTTLGSIWLDKINRM